MSLVPRWARIAVVVAAGATLLVACGDDKKSASSTTTTLATTTTLSQAQLDRQKAERVVLTAADVPGFTMDTPDPSDDTPELDAAANACVNNNPVLVQLGEDTDTRGVGGDDFSKGETTSVGSSVTFAETEDQARTAITDASAATVPACLSRAISTELRKDTSLTNVSVTAAKLPNLTVGDQSVGIRATARARASGTALTVYIDFTFIRVGRGLAVLDGYSVGSVFPEAERVRLATLIAQRMAA